MILGLLTRLGLLSTLVEYGYSLISILSVGFASGKLAILFFEKFFLIIQNLLKWEVLGIISNKNLFLLLLFPICNLPFYGILGSILMAFIISIIGFKSKKSTWRNNWGYFWSNCIFLTELVFLLGIIIVTVTVN